MTDAEPRHAASGSRRRVLLVTYYFPPAGGPGVQRAVKFVKYLPDFGWEPVVLTVREGAYPEHDATLQRDLPEDLRIEKALAWDPYRAYARLAGTTREKVLEQGSVQKEDPGWKACVAQWVRANFFLPDARVGWVPGAIRAGQRLLREERIDVVLTTGPPHSSHLAGRYLSWKTGVPWVADFRDPWTDINYYHELPHTRLARLADAAMERHVLDNASAVVTVSPAWKELLASKAENADDRFSVVQNGFDPADLKNVPNQSDDKFILSHVGSLYASRSPQTLWRVLGQLYRTGQLPDLEIRLVGPVDSAVRRDIEQTGLDRVTRYEGYVDHHTATARMQSSHLLLLSIERFEHDAGMITGKLYEYLSAGRPILGIGPEAGDAAQILNGTGAGAMFGRDDAAGMKGYVMEQYEAWSHDGDVRGADEQSIQPYTRRAQTGELARILDQVAK